MKEVCQTADLEIDWGYVKQVSCIAVIAQALVAGLGLTERRARMRRW
jgi:hypothetical protein